MSKDKPTFDVALSRFKTATRSSMKYAQICAEYSLRQFADHGNLNQAQAFMDAMPKNYVRRTAYLKWLAAHSPVTMQQGKLLKDVSDNAQPFNVEEALKVTFWDFAPDQEQIVWEYDDVVIALNKAIKKFENSEKYAPRTEEDVARFEAIKEKIANIA